MTTLPARRYDPETSHRAARAITESGVRARQVEMVIEAVKAHPGRTSAELAELMRWDRYMVARRLPEAEALQQVERAKDTDGKALKRRCHVTGTMAMVWWPWPAQRELRLTKAAP